MSWNKKTTDTHNMNVCESLCTSNPKTLKKNWGGGGRKDREGKDDELQERIRGRREAKRGRGT